MFKFFKKKEEKKFNKFENISPEPFIRLAKRNKISASKKIRERYSELTDYANSRAIAGIYKDHNLKGWCKLAELLSSSDPTLAKSIYIRILWALNLRLSEEVQVGLMPNREVIAQQLYNLESKISEVNEKGKLAVLSALVNGASPEQALWRDCLERMFDLASKVIGCDEEGRTEAIAVTAFYAENIPLFKDKALTETSQRLKSPYFLEKNNRSIRSKGNFFNRMNDFCIKEAGSSRNSAFKANPNSDLYLLLNEFFWQWVEQQIQEKSYNALVLLQRAIHSYDEALSLKASETYKQIFYEIAVQNPQKASECLQEIASYSCCYFTDGAGTEERHQNFNLYDVFDKTIPMLMALDKRLGMLPFSAFIKPHGNVPQRMQQRYGPEILSIQARYR